MICCPVCDSRFDPSKPGKPRSYAQHKRFFALLKEVLHHWPEKHDWQFANRHELRAWLTVKAGWRELKSQTPIVGAKPELVRSIVEGALRAVRSFAIPFVVGDCLQIWAPKSINYKTLSHQDACRLFDEVAIVIERETGLRAEQLLGEQAA